MAILAQRFPVFQRAMRIISNISNATAAVVTTTFNHQYETGMIVRINLPPKYGMQQINQQYAPIIVLSDTTFSMAIDSTLFEPFSVPTTFPFNKQSAQVTPIAEINGLLTSATQNVLPYRAT